MTRLITHTVKKVVYPLGDITDPLTGKKVISGKYRDYIDAVNKVYGESEGAFKYEDAPPRGWQEDQKDFTHVETYIKYHDSGEDDPYAV
jgi:small subunit ribosomal protein S17